MSGARCLAARRPAARLAALALVALLAPAALAEPVRVATLLPWVADALAGLDGAVVVASVARPGEALPAGVADLGTPHSPSYERLAVARPDVVVGERRLHGALAAELGRGGGRVLLLDASSVEGTFAGLLEVGRRTGTAEGMAERVAAARRELAALRLPRPVPVLPLFGAPGSFLAITGGTWLGDLLGELGLRNLAADAAGREAFPGYVDLSEEVLLTMRPAAVLLVTHGSPEAVEETFLRQRAAGGAWGALGGRLHVLDPALFGGNPGLRMPEAARRLVRAAGAGDGAGR